MLVANFTLCTTCKNNRGARRWAGARTPIWSPPAAGRGARSLTILYNSLQLYVLGKPGLPLARVAGLTLIYTYTQQELFYSIIASVCFCFSPHYYFLWLASGITVKREREVSSPDNTSSVPSLHLKLSYSCIWHKCVDLKEWNLYLINDKIIQSSVNKWNVNY